ncbi:MAG: PKD domain-containing protein, partial [Bacteroidia bacterium]|nr:PKD domain-containing protein [Bacteroidia bacterium]
MYKHITITGFLLFVFCFCKKEEKVDEKPRACFNTNERMYGSGETVFFQNCSENFDRVEWDFGDGQTSTLENPTFSWQEKGRHLVNLRVFKNELSSSAALRITVADSTYAGFRADFSNWEPGYNDSLITFSVYSIIANEIDTFYHQTVKAGSIAFLDPPVKGPGNDINS